MEIINLKYEQAEINCGRGSIFGNPFIIGKDGDRDEVVRKHKEWINKWLIEGVEVVLVVQGKRYSNKEVINNIEKLRGKKCGCYCKPLACHLDYLKEILEKRNANN